MQETILNKTKEWLKETLGEAGDVSFVENLSFGDVTTNVGIKNKNAPELLEKLQSNKPEFVSDISIAGPGFINISFNDSFLINQEHLSFPKNSEKIIVEYTDPNVMKPFHIGHLMSNSIGEAVAGLTEATGSEVIRMNYYSDVGLNIAKAVWGLNLMKQIGQLGPIDIHVLGRAYAKGVEAYDQDDYAKKNVLEINKIIFGAEDTTVSQWVTNFYKTGRDISLEYFNSLYEKLGSKFVLAIGESEVAEDGKRIVEEFLKKGLFEKSDGAIVFRGEKYNPKLHTRVFINSEGLPIYEAKELALTIKKFEKYNPDKSIVVTANEQNDYFKVVLEALRQIDKKYSDKTKHLSHGMLRLPTGKMSSRTGDVITAESLINTVADEAKKVIEKSGRSTDENLAEKIAIGAIKFSILRQHPGKDIIFDINKSISFEGDSGPYLMYTHARANSLIEKAKEEGIVSEKTEQTFGAKNLIRLLARFEDTLLRSAQEYSPNILVEYLLEISSEFNSWYAKEQMITENKNESAQKIYIVKSFKDILNRGLGILAISAPERM